MIDLTGAEKTAYNKATHCHICEGEIKVKRIVCKRKAAHSYCGKRDSEVSRDFNW